MRIVEGVDAGVPAHYGDPLREQRALAESCGVVDRSNRDVLVVPGADRLAWLHTICSQHVADLADGESTEALVLSPHGHVEQHWQFTEFAETVWLDVEPGTAADVLAYLQKMRFLKRVEPADVSADWAVLTVAGPSTADVLRAAVLARAPGPGEPPPAAGLPVPGDRAIALPGGGFVRASDNGADLVVPHSAAPAVLDALHAAGAAPVGMMAFEALRVEARRPRLGFETDHRTIPHEVGWIGGAVHLDKGCYRGQETVARVQNLGRPPRRLVLLHLAGESDVLPAPGTRVEFDGRPVGFLGTAAHHYELGPIALAVIKRSLPGDAALSVEGSAVAVD